MRCRLALPITLAIGLVALVAVSLTLAAPGDTSIVPFGLAQADNRDAYRALFSHLSGGGRAHWVQTGFTYAGTPYDPGTVLVPGGLGGGFAHTDISSTLTVRPSLGLSDRRVALFRSQAADEAGYIATWEVGDIRETLDVYLWGSLPYGIVEEQDIRDGALDDYDLLILPSIRLGDEASVVSSLGGAGLDAVRDFVQGGGTLYAQSSGAYVAEAAGLVGAGTVDLANPVQFNPADAFNDRGHLAVVDLASPLACSWLTDTLYVLTEPTLNPGGSLNVVAEFDNTTGDNIPAIAAGQFGQGRVVLVNGHPTSPLHRAQAPIFFDALLWGMSSRGELTGQAVQTYDPAVPPDLIPAYEDGVPISVTLTFANLWDGDLNNVVVTENVAEGFAVQGASVSPAPASIDIVTDPVTQTVIVWNLGTVPLGEVTLSYAAHTDAQVMKKGEVTFSTGEATFDRPADGSAARVWHNPFRLRSMMAARLEGDRDIERDRQYYIPEDGLYLDVTLPLENKEHTLADQIVITDVVLLIAPIVDLDDQETILGTNAGETIWIRNEPFFYDEPNEPYLAPEGYNPGDTVTLDDWDGAWAVFDVPYGTHGEIGPLGTGNYVTIPPAYTSYITLTADHKLLLPAKVLTWNYGAMPGCEYKEPALRYGVHSRELFSRTVTFAGDPGIAPDEVIIQGTGGSVYTHLGEYPIFYRDHLAAGTIVYAPEPPVSSTITYVDIWSRPHSLPLRAAFYDIFSWASCGSCGPGTGERHVALNVTFGLKADLDGDTRRDEPVLWFPSRLGAADLDLMIKSRGLGLGVPSNQMLIDEGIFHGLGVSITPRNGTWGSSWDSTSGSTQLVEITTTAAYDHLYFQHDVPAENVVAINIQAQVDGYEDTHREGMIKLHDGARLTYRQQAAGPSRYELYDSHVQGVVGLSSDAEIVKQVAPVQVSLYGDTIYYFLTVSDPYDPRHFSEDPYLHSYGFGNLAATTYTGGREKKQILHSIVEPGDVTRVRVEVNNNSGVTLTGVDVVPDPPPGITFTKMYTDPASVPPPIFFDIPFLHVSQIPDASRGVYYFEVQVDPTYSGPRGQVVEVPIHFVADNPPAGFQIPPAVLGIKDDAGGVSHVYALATDLTLTDTLPAMITLEGVVIVDASEVLSLTNAIIYDDEHGTDTASSVFAGFANGLSYTVDGSGAAIFDLPPSVQTVPADQPLRIVARAVLSGTEPGTSRVNEGAVITYQDPFQMTWSDQSQPVEVEAHGAAVHVSYNCNQQPVTVEQLGALADSANCLLEPGADNQVIVEVAAYNDGDYTAKSVTVTLHLADGVTLISAEPPYGSINGSEVTWNIGDIGPGGYKRFNITLQLSVAAAAQERLLIAFSDGSFRDDYSEKWVTGQLGGRYALPVMGRQTEIYLPLVLKAFSQPMPDLVVQDIIVTDPGGLGTGIQIVIANQGDAPVTGNFWVDFYIDPNPPPAGVNETWDNPPTRCAEGLVWAVYPTLLPLAPGEAVTLTYGDAYYSPADSHFRGYFTAGSHSLYAQADSANAQTTYGAVLENHEVSGGAYNNIRRLDIVVATAAGGSPPVEPSEGISLPANLPARP